ncbi:DUF2075 domain-containing protein [uncultured Phascolarctobacterium sp.]|uniref:DUF2075 domain-containing protein n=1 Tax=uncultured Phascolarctobacterium sp. TaxID=512296 RepID=UPI002603BECB|nr:DUF2075 domain-containing protein [uncultured Phascolarctobacterium sp.]
MQRAYYESSLQDFLQRDENLILGILTRNNEYALEDLQRNAWLAEIRILKKQLEVFETGHIIFEYTIPRIGERIDVVYLKSGLVFSLEFKVGEKNYSRSAIDQVTDYVLDLKNFHKASHNRILVPILVATEALERSNDLQELRPGILNVLYCNKSNLATVINAVLQQYDEKELDAGEWIESVYMPTPTIIEAAQALYSNHSVKDIARNDAKAVNLQQTAEAINKIIEESKQKHSKAICFITGVPGAGKTLAGLNIANERHNFAEEEHAVFLSGNKPLVDVLREALIRDESSRKNISKQEATKKVLPFIQMIHHFRDAELITQEPPNEKVVIFDEAQRAWTQEKLSEFMKRKKGVADFTMSEPEFLIDVMDRHKDWAVIICLVGGGQEINTGEAGLSEWFDALATKFPQWEIYVSDKITDSEYVQNKPLIERLSTLNHHIVTTLHLAVSLRSFRSEKVAGFVKALLDADSRCAQRLYTETSKNYPIFLTRNLQKAKEWVRSRAKGTERYGLIASSGAKRLRSCGIWVQSKIDAKHWFLDDKYDVRSSYALEEVATEFDIQGLEVDWSIVAWDADLRFVEDHFEYFKFIGAGWQRVNKVENQQYLKNTYRVLLTRARQGVIIFVPEGDEHDETRHNAFYDETYNYLKKLGLNEL